MTDYETFYIQKSPQAFDDTLIAFGLATVIQELFEDAGGVDINITDRGAYYQLALNQALTQTLITERSLHLMPAKALATNKTKLPEGIQSDHYETIRDAVGMFHEARKKGTEPPPYPSAPWDVYRAINPASLAGYNNLMTDWYTVRDTPEVLAIIFDLYANLPNDVDGAIDRWKALNKEMGWKIKREATKQSLYNPDSGKGQNKSKMDGLSISNVKNFWLAEWLKAVGFYEVAITKQLRGVKDRKTLVLAPRELTFDRHQVMMEEFRDAMQVSETSIRFDVLASVRYTRVLLNYALEQVQKRRRVICIKQELVLGFHTAFYKDMGNAVATMNLSFIALPGWVVVETADDVADYREVLEELEKLVRQFDESRSDDATLLQHLRDFLSGDALDAFFRFTNAFTTFYMGKRERNQYAYQLTTDLIERIVMSTEKKLSPILQNEGFQNIAYAIRQATVTAQYRKKQKDTKYEVRYGLGQELTRKARYPQDFIVALSDFLHKYNAENARVMEIRPQPYRRSIQTSDIDEIVKLIDDYGSETVANLLIAYGHARISRDELPNEETTEQENK